jgi:2-oxo-3-hexenedioate decarboxylase
MPTPDPKSLARELFTSYENAAPLDAPLSTTWPDFALNDAYAVETEFRRLREAQGRTVTGLKVGYANKAMWRVLKLETLVWASMYDDTIHDGSTLLAIERFMSPRLEPEIVFNLKQPVSGDLDAAGALGCVEWMALGFEIIDCPFPGWQFKPADFVAAYGLHRGLIIGEHRTVDSSLIEGLASFKLRLLRNDELVDEGGGKNSLRSPALCLAELGRASGGLKAGELVSTGTLTNAQPMTSGEQWRAEVEGLPLPALNLRVA